MHTERELNLDWKFGEFSSVGVSDIGPAECCVELEENGLTGVEGLVGMGAGGANTR